MGNFPRCHECRENAKKMPSFLSVARRTWKILVGSDSEKCACTDRCSEDCKEDCIYHQEFTFDSESEMAPNADDDLLDSMGRTSHSSKVEERLRPPTYNAEDYVIALRKWGRRPLGNQDSHGSSSSGYASGNGEMTLRQFTSVTELVHKLRQDLRLAFPSFVQEFSMEGMSFLLETLRAIQLTQSTPKMGQRRPALDELGCLECFWLCVERFSDGLRYLAQANSGLLALAACLTSSINKSRIIALQLLTKVCQSPGGYTPVSEAVSTLRLCYAEGARFRFLAGALLAPKAQTALRVAGLAFMNALMKSSPNSQAKLYIQAEACEAGLEPKVVQQWLKFCESESGTLDQQLKEEVLQWCRHCVDIEALEARANRAEETCRALNKKVTTLQRQLQRLGVSKVRQSSSAEDEGISFSERSSSPDDPENDQETTIDDVIEELRTIVKDAEEEFGKANARESHPSKARECLHDIEQTARLDKSLKIIVPGPQNYIVNKDEPDIIPSLIYPQPPKRSPACILGATLKLKEENPIDDESDSLLSASKLKGSNRQYSRCSGNALQRRTERRKYLRRCQSQDQIENHGDSHFPAGKGVIDRIRKFESMTAFDDHTSLPNLAEQLKRSESFHQTRLNNVNSSQKSRTKSLDRIIQQNYGPPSKNEKRSKELPRSHDDHWPRQKFASFFENSIKHNSDSRLFASRPHDILGFGKYRLNAGKYSGSSQSQLAKNIHRHMNATPVIHGVRGKVTDIVSGLY